MGFKMKGWSAFSKPEPVSPLTDPTDKIKKRNQPEGNEILDQMEVPIEGTEDYQGIPDTEQKYTPEEIADGAGASADFFGKKHGGFRNKLEFSKGSKPGNQFISDREFGVVGQKGDRSTLNVDITTGKAKKAKNVAKKNIFTGNLSIPLDSLKDRDKKADNRGLESEKETGEYVYNVTGNDDVPWSFEGPMNDNIADKDISERKRRAKLNTKTGIVEEQYMTTFGTWRTTGRTLNQGAPDPAYVDAAQENIQEAADWEAGEEQRKIDADAKKEKDKLDKQAQKEAANAAREAGETSYEWNGLTYNLAPKFQ